MAFRIKSYREKYFEEHVAVPDPKRPGKVKYVYSGDYVEPFVEGQSISKWKILMSALEAAGIVIFLISAVIHTEFNEIRIVSGLGILQIVPWGFAIWSLIRFLICSGKMEETTYESIGRWYGPGVIVRLIILLAMIVYGALNLSSEANLLTSILAMAGHLISGILSVVVWRLYKRVYYYTHRQHEEDYNPNYVKAQK